MSEMQSREMRRYAAIRSALIGYGVLAFSFFPATRTLMLWGIGVQVAVILIRQLIQRQVRDPAAADMALMTFEVIADGATVALFAISTFSGIMRTSAQI
jgi:hypothetical protein